MNKLRKNWLGATLVSSFFVAPSPAAAMTVEDFFAQPSEVQADYIGSLVSRAITNFSSKNQPEMAKCIADLFTSAADVSVDGSYSKGISELSSNMGRAYAEDPKKSVQGLFVGTVKQYCPVPAQQAAIDHGPALTAN